MVLKRGHAVAGWERAGEVVRREGRGPPWGVDRGGPGRGGALGVAYVTTSFSSATAKEQNGRSGKAQNGTDWRYLAQPAVPVSIVCLQTYGVRLESLTY